MFNTVRPLEANTMSFSRRRRQHLSSTRMNQVEVQGETYLCFSQDYSWFQGNVSTDDDSNYSVYGQKIQGNSSSGIQLPPSSTASTPNESEDEVDSDLHSDLHPAHVDQYRMILTDHFTGLNYVLNDIAFNSKALQNPNASLLNSSDARIHFRVDQVHKGQKADMLIQRTLGSTSSLLGKRCLVFCGHLDMVFTDYEGMDSGRCWSL